MWRLDGVLHDERARVWRYGGILKVTFIIYILADKCSWIFTDTSKKKYIFVLMYISDKTFFICYSYAL